MSIYRTLTARSIDPTTLPVDEQKLFSQLLEESQKSPDWVTFSVFWTKLLRDVLRGLPPENRTKHPLYKMAQDLEMRLGIAQGAVAEPDYRDYLIDRIEEKFGSRYRFCKATGIPEAELSQVLSGKKSFSVKRLVEAARALDMGLVLMPKAELTLDALSEKKPLKEAADLFAQELASVEAVAEHLKHVEASSRWKAFLKERSLLGDTLLHIEEELRNRPAQQRNEDLLPELERLRATIDASLTHIRRKLASLHEGQALGEKSKT